MKLLLCGAGMSLTGLLVLLAMVMRVVEPGLLLSLLGYAGLVVGMLVAVAGATRLARQRR
ncbi:hypothetical protein [Litchfieldella rifensis]|uniref:NADH dehydrogenase subunit 6 n=1 Tax=Litchfieldella rifensis TaxID=762643 RepID=A0ABV7LQM1_9GAMM